MNNYNHKQNAGAEHLQRFGAKNDLEGKSSEAVENLFSKQQSI